MSRENKVPDGPPRFFCDAMHGGLARWLRAAGYDAAWEYGIDDRTLLERARREGRIVLTSDGPLMERRAIRRGEPRALFVPRGLDSREALRYVLDALSLPVLDSHCMSCGGSLERVPKESVASEAPPRTYVWLDRFYRCSRCGKLYWEGTHWKSIGDTLAAMRARGAASGSAPAPEDGRAPAARAT
ncbi:MAG: Mut7-C RNAse domain-containing protein [Planctomycetota bacterium]